MEDQEKDLVSDNETPKEGQNQETEQKTDDAKTEDKTYNQSELDSIISKSLKTHREKWEKLQSEKEQKAEEERLLRDKKYEELLELREKSDRDRQVAEQTSKLVNTLGLNDLYDDLVSDLNQIDNKKSLAKNIKSIIDAKVKTEVEKKLTTPNPPEENNTNTSDWDDLENYKNWKKTQNKI